MLMSKKKSYKLEGDMSYKQSWRIAHNFANQCNEIFPDYDPKKLAHLLQGAIYYYHEEIKALFVNLYPDNKEYLKIRNYYRFYLVIYVIIFAFYFTLR